MRRSDVGFLAARRRQRLCASFLPPRTVCAAAARRVHCRHGVGAHSETSVARRRARGDERSSAAPWIIVSVHRAVPARRCLCSIGGGALVGVVCCRRRACRARNSEVSLGAVRHPAKCASPRRVAFLARLRPVPFTFRQRGGSAPCRHHHRRSAPTKHQALICNYCRCLSGVAIGTYASVPGVLGPHIASTQGVLAMSHPTSRCRRFRRPSSAPASFPAF